MDTTIKAEWLAALRSGKYQQTKGSLRNGNRFCCLGVLCDVVNPKNWRDDDSYLDQDNVLPGTIVENFDIYDVNPVVHVTEEEKQLVLARSADEMLTHDKLSLSENRQRLASLNDYGLSFTEIANIIEREL